MMLTLQIGAGVWLGLMATILSMMVLITAQENYERNKRRGVPWYRRFINA